MKTGLKRLRFLFGKISPFIINNTGLVKNNRMLFSVYHRIVIQEKRTIRIT